MSDPDDPYVVGLLLVLVVLSAIPMFAQGITWFAVILLVMVWSGIAVNGAKKLGGS